MFIEFILTVGLCVKNVWVTQVLLLYKHVITHNTCRSFERMFTGPHG